MLKNIKRSRSPKSDEAETPATPASVARWPRGADEAGSLLLMQMGYTMKIIDGLSSHEIDADDIQKFGVGRTNTGADNFHLEGDDAMSRTFDSAEAAVAHAEDSGLHNIFALIDDGRKEGACWFPVIIK